MIKLVEPSVLCFEHIKTGLSEIKNNRTPYDIHAVERLLAYMDKDFEGYMEYLNSRKQPNQPAGRVPSTTLFLFDDDQFIGVYNIRHCLNEHLKIQGGHIAYQIIPSERRKGYVKAGLKLVLKWCRQNLNLNEVLLFCNAKNIASDRAMTSVMEEVGGHRVPDHTVDGVLERGVWIKTPDL